MDDLFIFICVVFFFVFLCWCQTSMTTISNINHISENIATIARILRLYTHKNLLDRSIPLIEGIAIDFDRVVVV